MAKRRESKSHEGPIAWTMLHVIGAAPLKSARDAINPNMRNDDVVWQSFGGVWSGLLRIVVPPILLSLFHWRTALSP